MYSARVVAHSIGPCNIPLVSILLRYPRMVHADFLRHRCFSYSVASSRAIPSEKLRARIEANPATIAWWGKNQKGMVAEEELAGEELVAAKAAWDRGMEASLGLAIRLEELGLHKQLANRVLEPWMDVEQLTTGTEWENFFGLRRHRDAQPEIQRIAHMAFDAIGASAPKRLAAGQWHLPFIIDDDLAAADKKFGGPIPCFPPKWLDAIEKNYGDFPTYWLTKISAARVARTSYLNHEGRLDYDKDVGLFARLVEAHPGHWSPLEHVCRAMAPLKWNERAAIMLASILMPGGRGTRMRRHGGRFLLGSGNLTGWQQLRKLYEAREHIGGPRP